MNEEILNKVSNKTNVDKDLIIKLAQKLSNGNMKDELNCVYNLINDAMLNGKHAVMFSNKTLMKSTYEFLKSKGFNIDHFYGDQRDPADDTTISW